MVKVAVISLIFVCVVTATQKQLDVIRWADNSNIANAEDIGVDFIGLKNIQDDNYDVFIKGDFMYIIYEGRTIEIDETATNKKNIIGVWSKGNSMYAIYHYFLEEDFKYIKEKRKLGIIKIREPLTLEEDIARLRSKGIPEEEIERLVKEHLEFLEKSK